MLPEQELTRSGLQARYDALQARGLKIDMTRGKPCEAQVALSDGLLELPGAGGGVTAEGVDARNYYGGPTGLREARELFAAMLGADPDEVAVANNSSLALMHDAIVFALLHGLSESQLPWKAGPARFICPSPGYDRHFAICEAYGIEMLPVAMTGSGPEMDQVEVLVRDPAVKGMWCVPQYSNPTGETYSDAVIERLATMKTAAPDFRLFWDNAYAVHHLTHDEAGIPSIIRMCEQAGHPDRPFVFASTSKITFAGGGLGLFASSRRNIGWYVRHAGIRSIGPDKLNQLRHVRFLRDHDGIRGHMRKHRSIIAPKFKIVEDGLQRLLGGMDVARWTTPKGGYFVSLQVRDGCAARVVELAHGLGVALVPAGKAYPLGKDPRDAHLRLAPTYPDATELAIAVECIGLSVLLATVESGQHTFSEGQPRSKA